MIQERSFHEHIRYTKTGVEYGRNWAIITFDFSCVTYLQPKLGRGNALVTILQKWRILNGRVAQPAEVENRA